MIERERRSALAAGALLSAVAAWNVYRGREPIAWTLGAAGAGLLIAGAFVPAAARAFHGAWMGAAKALGWINSRILLTIFFYGVLTPVGLCQRLFGRNVLDRRGAGRESYWVRREKSAQPRERFERLF